MKTASLTWPAAKAAHDIRDRHTEESAIVPLFFHTLRADWGVAILARELDDKRHYLFEDGQERALATGFGALMQRIEAPTLEQHAAYAKLRRLADGERKDRTPDWVGLDAQLERLRQLYPGGLSDPNWAELRASTAKQAFGREPAIEHARSQLAPEELAAMLRAGQFEGVWARVVSVWRLSALLPAEQILQAPPKERLRELAVAACGLFGSAALNAVGFDRFVAAITTATGHAPSWALVTAPAAFLYPREHVYVDRPCFRMQLELSGIRRAIPERPNAAAYAVVLKHTRALVQKLAEHGEAPRDLLDVRDFIHVTLRPPDARKKKAPGKPA